MNWMDSFAQAFNDAEKAAASTVASVRRLAQPRTRTLSENGAVVQ